MAIEGNGVIDIVDAEGVFGEARNIRAEQPAAGCEHKAMILKGLSFSRGVNDLYGAVLRINRFDTTLHVGDIDGVKYILQRRRQGLGIRLVKPWADDKRRFRGYQRDFKLFGRDAFDIAQTGCGKCSVHAGETGAYNHKSHNVYSVSWGLRATVAAPNGRRLTARGLLK